MAQNETLAEFVREALVAGKGRQEISEALQGAGWSVSETADALAAWADTPFSPPIPRPQVTVSARDFFVYALTFGLLITGAAYLVALLHALIDQAFDDAAYSAARRIRWGLSALIVTVPLYLWLTVRERGRLARDPALYRSAMRKWLTYITLLIAAVVLLGDLIATIYALLNGDLTGQFVLKAGVVAAVAGGIFLFYLSDVRRGDAT